MRLTSSPVGSDKNADKGRDGNAGASTGDLTALVFSHRPEVREAIISAVGRRPAPELPRVSFVQAATIDEVLRLVDGGAVDLAVLDGEAQPTGGMGLSRQLKNEITDCPPIVIAVQRRDDRWLATWSQADAVIVHPLDPVDAAATVAALLRRLAGRALRSSRPAAAPDPAGRG